MGFLQICAGVILLQLSKSAKDVPDAAVFAGGLDQVRTVAEQEQPESEPKADAIRGTAAIIRRISMSRQKMEVAEAKKVHEDRMKDQMEPIGENEQVEWDGLRRRKTVLSPGGSGTIIRRKTLHPPLGLTHFPTDDNNVHDADDENGETRPTSGHSTFHGSFLDSVRRRAHSTLVPHQRKHASSETSDAHPVALTDLAMPPSYKSDDPSEYPETSHIFGLPSSQQQQQQQPQYDGSYDDLSSARLPSANSNTSYDPTTTTRPPAPAKRQFSFQNPFHKKPASPSPSEFSYHRPPTATSHRRGLSSRAGSRDHNHIPGAGLKSATEEERLGLVKGDSHALPPLPGYHTDEDEEVDVDVDEGSSGIDWGGVGGVAPRPVTGLVEERERERRNVLVPRERDGDGRGDGSGVGRGGGGSGGGGGGAFI